MVAQLHLMRVSIYGFQRASSLCHCSRLHDLHETVPKDLELKEVVMNSKAGKLVLRNLQLLVLWRLRNSSDRFFQEHQLHSMANQYNEVIWLGFLSVVMQL